MSGLQMNKGEYDGLEGMSRLFNAEQANGQLSAEIIIFHAALETELVEVLSNLMPRPECVLRKSPPRGFGHKVNLLKALWTNTKVYVDPAANVLFRFNALRNCVAHSDDRKAFETHHKKLHEAYKKIDPSCRADPSILEVAQGVCLYLQDGSNLSELAEAFSALSNLANNILPKAFPPDPK
jgi:hypothetical protein